MGITLTIVEDLDEVREGLNRFLSLNPEFKVLDTFKTAEEAICELPSLKPDIVIMDINLPGINGIDCIREVKSRLPRTQFMMFTVYENDEKVFEALKAGASGYLLKSTGLMQLIEAVKELYNGGSPMSSNIARKLVTMFREKEKDLAVAEKEYRAAIDASQGQANDWLNLALFYRHGNKLDDMEQALMRAANAPKGQNEVLVEASEILQRSGRNLPEATQLARRYIASNSLSEKSPLFKAHYVLGTALEKQGDKEGAAQEYRAALALAGNFSAAQQALKNVSKQ